MYELDRAMKNVREAKIEKVARCIQTLRLDACLRDCSTCKYNVTVDDFNKIHFDAIELIESEKKEMNKMKENNIYIGVDPASEHSVAVKTMKESIDEMIIPLPVKAPPAQANTPQLIMETCESVAAMLTDKNKKYGDSALIPINVFSKAPPGESLVARIDDKLARIKNNDNLLRDDVMDIIGYLILLLIENGWTGYNHEEKLDG